MLQGKTYNFRPDAAWPRIIPEPVSFPGVQTEKSLSKRRNEKISLTNQSSDSPNPARNPHAALTSGKPMKPKIVLISICLLFGGCIIQSHKSTPEGHSTTARRAALKDFAGSFENHGVDYAKRNQATLAGILSSYMPGNQDADTVIHSITASRDFEMTAFKDGNKIIHTVLKKEDGFKFSGSKFNQRSGSHQVDPMFVAGTERWSSYFFITQDGSLGFRYKNTFRGIAYIIPAFTKTEDIYIFRRKTEPNQALAVEPTTIAGAAHL